MGGVAACAVALSGALAGCSVSNDNEPEPQGTSESSNLEEPTETQTQTPTQTPTQTATQTAGQTPGQTPSDQPTPAETPAATALPSPEAALLSAAELPQLNDTTRWTEGATDVPGARPFGQCQQFDMATIGAMDAIERIYTAGRDTAGQLVAEFPDAQNAVRASKVLEAWHRECRVQVKGRSVKVRPITEVSVPHGKAWWYLVSYERRGSGHFHSLGMVLSGARMALIRMDHDGQDHNYEPGQDPVELAIRAVSARLG